MKLVHIQGQVAEKVKKPTAKQVYHEQMVAALRRRKYLDFLAALKDPEVIQAVNEAKKLNPDFKLTFDK